MTAPSFPEGRFRQAANYDVAPRGTATRGRVVAWVMIRVTGLLLSVLVLGHFGMTHILTDVSDTGANFVARRWASIIWLVWDWLLLACALLHGASGVWIAISDYAIDDNWRAIWQRLLTIVSALILLLGSAAIVAVGRR